ncbi:MAG: MarR family EPS-associated transcriptional regulator [Desulfobacterales bacterium]|nr:MarR family EPS-associated transcriptional regulator [Desulfobacterales bacterium]
MEPQNKEFLILEALDAKENITQRQLSKQTGISLGQANYVLKSLMVKGLVKLEKFHKNSNKAKYVYLLTPKGIEAKSRLAVNFVVSKLKEYDSLRLKIEECLLALSEDHFDNFVFYGPDIVKDLITSVISDKNININISAHKSDINKFDKSTCNASGVVIFFDDNPGIRTEIKDLTGISSKNIISLL